MQDFTPFQLLVLRDAIAWFETNGPDVTDLPTGTDTQGAVEEACLRRNLITADGEMTDLAYRIINENTGD